jgi:hypothetical protein
VTRSAAQVRKGAAEQTARTVRGIAGQETARVRAEQGRISAEATAHLLRQALQDRDRETRVPEPEVRDYPPIGRHPDPRMKLSSSSGGMDWSRFPDHHPRYLSGEWTLDQARADIEARKAERPPVSTRAMSYQYDDDGRSLPPYVTQVSRVHRDVPPLGSELVPGVVAPQVPEAPPPWSDDPAWRLAQDENARLEGR